MLRRLVGQIPITARSFLAIKIFFFASRRRNTRFSRDWSSDVCSSDLDVLSSVLANEFVGPKIRNKEKDLDFAALQATFEKEHPYVDMAPILTHAKAQYYFVQKNWPAFKDAVNEMIATNNKNISPTSLNSFAWSVFENCDDPACVQAALT